MKLVACRTCRTQYDAAGVPGESFTCRCGARVAAKAVAAVDAPVTRCAACGALVGDSDRVCPYCQATVARRFAPAGPVCPQCYARNPESARHCVACGVAFDPQPVRPAESTDCPVCPGIRLAARNLGGLWVDECPSCLGLWAPGDVLDRLVDRVRERYRREGAPTARAGERKRSAVWQARVEYRKCPVCGGRMQRKNFAGHSGVVVDWCGEHGSWLDAGETEDIAAFILEGGLRSVPEGEVAAAGFAGDRARAAAALAADRILAEERARATAIPRPHVVDWARGVRSVGDLLAKLLK